MSSLDLNEPFVSEADLIDIVAVDNVVDRLLIMWIKLFNIPFYQVAHQVRSSHVLANAYKGGHGSLNYENKLANWSSGRSAPVWLETGDAVGNIDAAKPVGKVLEPFKAPFTLLDKVKQFMISLVPSKMLLVDMLVEIDAAKPVGKVLEPFKAPFTLLDKAEIKRESGGYKRVTNKQNACFELG
ncbi:hypothetical protein CTI12_AA355320 [Artemisia annua]|uniref:Uncharacterized protein n=1 Tax=Artemisia annua TaxID=35608 RepID=A0A2U1MQ76_ARTAN|nr:hypothetical protein CTI12_AA355320 [Artemisia annua]